MTATGGGKRRIALLTHSTNPRGGVAHCLALAEALTALGHEAVVHAPDPAGRGFYRPAACGCVSVAAEPPIDRDPETRVGSMVEQRIGDYRHHFEAARHRGFDLYHAHDGIGANALADLAEAGLVPGFVRTVHHIDNFADPRIAARQIRAVVAADLVFCVSDLWVEVLRRDYGLVAHRVANGVDGRVFSPRAEVAGAADDIAARRALGLADAPYFLSVGGFEPRKNSLAILEALALLRRSRPEARLAVVGGASVLDHAGYAARCREALRLLDLDRAVVVTGAVPQAAMPALYRGATGLVFPSLSEGFGLAVIEAMACGTPVVASRIAPFTEYLTEADALLVAPEDPAAIAAAMAQLLVAETRHRLTKAGFAVARRFDWRASARQHLELYAGIGSEPPAAAAGGGLASRQAAHG